MKKVILLSSILFFFSCINVDKKMSKKNTINDYITITICAKVLENDVFEIFFSEDPKKSYVPENKVKTIVKGRKEFQEIKFKFPSRVYPMKFRIDIGLNGYESIVEISEIKISTGRNTIIFSEEKIDKYFRANNYVNHIPNTKKFNRVIRNGVYDPFLLSIDLSKEIVDLFSYD